MTDIYRKQAARLEQLEKANRKLEKELKESEERRMKAMDEAEELREAKGELPILMERAKQADNKDEEIEKLVRILSAGRTEPRYDKANELLYCSEAT